MIIKDIIEKIEIKHKEYGIDVYPPATAEQLNAFEQKLGFALPPEFKEFYSTCNGFYCTEDFFRIVPLEDALKYESDYGKNWFVFAEYMIYTDCWSLRKIGDNAYEIYCESDVGTVLTTSLYTFLEHVLAGCVFKENGLYEWLEERKAV